MGSEIRMEINALNNKNILYLGSSVTCGANEKCESFVEIIAEKTNSFYLKEAVSGTTLVYNGIDDYITRLKRVDKTRKFDLFVCQLSTNDATQNKELGNLCQDPFDTTTITGAILEIVRYVKETFHCPILFYTGSFYENKQYALMVNRLKELAKTLNFDIIDLYTDASFNNISKELYNTYMLDPIHPTIMGYEKWWVPKMLEIMNKVINTK